MAKRSHGEFWIMMLCSTESKWEVVSTGMANLKEAEARLKDIAETDTQYAIVNVKRIVMLETETRIRIVDTSSEGAGE